MNDNEMTECQQRVAKFMEKAGQAVPDKPQIPGEEIRLLRANLILEKALETINALGFHIGIDGGKPVLLPTGAEPNLTEIVDGCADIQVVTIGTLLACGVCDKRPQQLVDESNLAKFELPQCPECRDYLVWDWKSKTWYCRHSTCHVTGVSKETGPYRRDDGKWIKPPYWQKPPLEAELLRQELGFQLCANCGGRLFKQTQNPQTSTLYGFWVCEKGGTFCPIVDTASLKLRLNPKPYVQSISMVHEEALLAHNGWFAVMDKPICKVGQPIEFAYAGGGRVVKSGIVTAIDAPGTHKFSPFESWWVIEFSERKAND